MTDHEPTARLSLHARRRCAEMGIVTRRVKQVVRRPDFRYATHSGRQVVCRDDEPTFKVVICGWDVVTVVRWTYDDYEHPAPGRPAETLITYSPIKAAA
jgi:hypothetical protein